MFYKMVTILSIISVTHETPWNLKQQYPISSSSFVPNRGPISYHYSPIPNHRTKNVKPQHGMYHPHNLESVKYPIIQYAPLPALSNSKNQDHHKEAYQIEKKSITIPIAHLIESGRHVYSTKSSRKELEPRTDESVDEHRHNYKSFVPGHNVEVLSPLNRVLERIDPFKAQEDINHRQQEITSKIEYYHKKEDAINIVPSSMRTEDIIPKTEKYGLLNYLPPKYKARVASKDTRSLPFSYSLHNQLAREKPVPTYQHGQRLHLNIARIYSIAKQLHKGPLHAPAPQAHASNRQSSHLSHFNLMNLPKPTSLSKYHNLPDVKSAKKTIMHPVKKPYKDNLAYSSHT